MEFTDAQRELLDGPYLAIIATIGPSGRPTPRRCGTCGMAMSC